MPRAGERSVAKEQHWRSVLADQRAGKLSIAAYCQRNGIKDSQFYEWQRKIKQRDAEAAAGAQRRKENAAKEHRKSNPNRETVEFAEVHVTDLDSPAGSSPEGCDSLEVVFANGITVRLTTGCSLDLFSSVVSILEKR